MISCVSPSNHSANHSINTLRYSMRLKEKPTNHGNGKNNINIMINNNYMKQIQLKKNVISNKNRIMSSSPNIKLNHPSKKNNKFRLIEKQVNKNNFNTYNNANYSQELNQNKSKFVANSNKNIKLNTQKLKNRNLNPNQQRSPNLRKTAFTNYLNKKHTTENNKNVTNNNKSNNKNNKNNTKNTKQGTKNRYSTLVANKKKQLDRTQSYSNNINDYTKENINKDKIAKNAITYNNNFENNYITNPPRYAVLKNIDLNNDIDPRQEYDDLITDQIDDINSQQKYLTDDKILINKFKGLAKDNEGKEMYKPVIENIIQSKMNYLNQLQDNIVEYKKLLNKYK